MADSGSRRNAGGAQAKRSSARAGRVEGRRSLAAYEAISRGEPERVAEPFRHPARRTSGRPRYIPAEAFDAACNAGVAFKLVFPLLTAWAARKGSDAKPSRDGGKGKGMKRKPSIRSLETVTLEEANAYLEWCGGDELNAAFALATDRSRLDGSTAAPDDHEVHHALFMLCAARGLDAPSFDEMRVELRRRVAA
jgi:hypothetical protein